MGFQLRDDVVPVLVKTDGAHNEPLVSELRGMVGEIRRGAAQGLPEKFSFFMELVPQDFSDPNDKSLVFVHTFLFSFGSCRGSSYT